MKNEYDAMEDWRKYCKKYGAHTVRIENIGLSLPDILYMKEGLVAFHEVKMLRGKCFYMPKHQWANNVVMSVHLFSWQLIYPVYNTDGFDVYSLGQVKQMDKEPSGNKIKVHIGESIPVATITDYISFKAFMDTIPGMSNAHSRAE